MKKAFQVLSPPRQEAQRLQKGRNLSLKGGSLLPGMMGRSQQVQEKKHQGHCPIKENLYTSCIFWTLQTSWVRSGA